jgi:replication factor A3
MATTGMDVSAPSPRVNFQSMGAYIGKRVRLVGKVESVQGNVMRVKAADEGVVEVLTKSAVPQDAFVEVDGIVESPNTLREESLTGFGNTFGERPRGGALSAPCVLWGVPVSVQACGRWMWRTMSTL